MIGKKWPKSALWGLFKTRKGWCAIAWSAKGLMALVLPQKEKALALRKLQEYLPPGPQKFWEKSQATVPLKFQRETGEALRGKPFSNLPVDLFSLTPFQQRILQETCRIPWGQYRSYAWVARKAGSPKGFRATGQALNRNPVPIFIPCHRVVASGGKLGGYGGGLEWKVKLLELEGIRPQKGGKLAPGLKIL